MDCTATKCRSTPKCRMSDSSTSCSMNMIRRQSTVTFTFPARLRNGIGSMSVPFSTVWRESGFALGTYGKALPDHLSQGLRVRVTSSNSPPETFPSVFPHRNLLLKGQLLKYRHNTQNGRTGGF